MYFSSHSESHTLMVMSLNYIVVKKTALRNARIVLFIYNCDIADSVLRISYVQLSRDEHVRKIIDCFFVSFLFWN